MQLIFGCRPKSVLDIGVGFGKFGVLAREYLELWDGRNKYDDWSHRIDGIEAFKEYLTPLHEYIYDNVYTGNALSILPQLDFTYDLILLIDVLEHFTYDDGQLLLELCQQKGRNFIVSTPLDIGVQADVFDNPFETHRFQWQPWHFERFEKYVHVQNPKSHIYLIGEAAQQFSQTPILS
jgi:hypothetical protein